MYEYGKKYEESQMKILRRLIMILFVGVVLAWGAGLQYEYLIEKENYSFEQI